MDIELYRKAVRIDSPDGFETFYGLMTNRVLPAHARHWVERTYDARKADKGYLCESFRGSTKTTTFNTWTAWRTGLKPEDSHLRIQATDDSAKENIETIANIIRYNPAWRALFPELEPDMELGWSAEGYNVKRTDMAYDQWVRLKKNVSSDDTLKGYGYDSNSIIGKHPSGSLIVDDIHTDKNTASDREMKSVHRIVTGTIFPCRIPNDPWTVFVFTPWRDDDVPQKLKATGEFLSDVTPGYVEDPDGVLDEDIGRTIRLTWPEGLGLKEIQKQRRMDITGGLEFARMILCDLTKARNREFVYQTYPHDLINWSWPMVGGVDYAGIADASKRDQYHSHFALAYCLKLPEGGVVIADGVLEQCGQGESEQYVLKAQQTFPMWQFVAIESDGKGVEFVQLMTRHPNMVVYPTPTKGKGKAWRLQHLLQGNLRIGRVKISDADTKYLNALRQFLNRYPEVNIHDPGWDAADAAITALVNMTDVLQMPSGDDMAWSIYAPKRRVNPFSALAHAKV